MSFSINKENIIKYYHLNPHATLIEINNILSYNYNIILSDINIRLYNYINYVPLPDKFNIIDTIKCTDNIYYLNGERGHYILAANKILRNVIDNSDFVIPIADPSSKNPIAYILLPSPSFKR